MYRYRVYQSEYSVALEYGSRDMVKNNEIFQITLIYAHRDTILLLYIIATIYLYNLCQSVLRILGDNLNHETHLCFLFTTE